MKIEEHADFNCRPDALLAMFTDRDYFLRKHERLGATDIEVVEHADDGDRFAITVQQRVPQNTPLPGFLKRLVGERIGVVQSDAWQRSDASGRIVVELAAAPVTVGVDLTLSGKSGGSRLHLHFDIQAGVPVIGGRIERFLADDVIARMRDDLDETRRILAEYAA